LLHGKVASGSKSAGIKFFVWHPPQLTIFNGLRSVLVVASTIEG
jgi:hypothetical protein